MDQLNKRTLPKSKGHYHPLIGNHRSGAVVTGCIQEREQIESGARIGMATDNITGRGMHKSDGRVEFNGLI